MPPMSDNPAIIDQHFNQVDQGPNDKCKTYECTYCKKRYAMNVTRMKLHLKACTKCPPSVKNTLKIKRHRSSLQAALLKSELLPSSNLYEQVVKIENVSQDLSELNDNIGSVSMYGSNVNDNTMDYDDFSRANEHLHNESGTQDNENQSLVYQHYTKLAEKPNDKCTTFECNYCSKKYAKNVTRMKLHLISCSKSPADVQKSFKIKRHLMSKMELTRNATEMYESFGAPEFVEVGDNYDSMNLSNMLHSIRKLSKRETSLVWTLLARACYASGMSFDFIENPYWLMCFKKIRPNLALPSRQHLCTTLLDNEYVYMKRAIEEKLSQAPSLCLQIYGWSNIKDDSNINIVILTPSGPLLYKTVLGGSNRHTAKYLMQLIQQVFDKVGVEKFVSVMTDNVKNMAKVLNLFSGKYSNNLALYCCSSLALGCLIQDIIRVGPIRNLSNIAITIIKKLKSSLTLRNIYTVICSQIDNEKPLDLILPSKTRRESIVNCLEHFINNETNLKSLAINEEGCIILDNTVDYILDNDYWATIRSIYDLLKPIADTILILESEHSTLSILPVLFQTIKKHLNASIPRFSQKLKFEANEVFSAFEERKTLALHSIHYAANLLDPRTRGEALNGDEIIEGISYISSLATPLGVNKTEVISDLALYRTKQGLWNKNFVWDALEAPQDGKELPSISWWNGICSSSPLARIASAILLSPPTVVTSEKLFKSYTLTQAKIINKLPNARAAKLVFITHNLRIMDEDVRITKMKNEDSITNTNDENYMETNEMVDVTDMDEVCEIESNDEIEILTENIESENYDEDSDYSIYVFSDMEDIDDD